MQDTPVDTAFRPPGEPEPLPQAEPAGLPAPQPLPPGPGRTRRVTSLAGLVAATAVVGSFAVWGSPSVDGLDAGQRRAMLAAAESTVLSPTRIDLSAPQQMEEARRPLILPASREVVGRGSALTPNQADAIIADARAGKVQLAWISLRDFLDEDGDVVEISTGGLTRTIPLTKAPLLVAVPVVPGDFLRVTGAADGHGGGVTVAVAAGGSEAAVPLEVGQTLTLPVR